MIPPGPAEPWFVDTLTARRWRLVFGDRILATDNAGRTWRTIIAKQSFGPLFYAYNPPAAPVVDFTSSTIGWVFEQDFATSINTLWRTVDGGRQWQQVKIPGT